MDAARLFDISLNVNNIKLPKLDGTSKKLYRNKKRCVDFAFMEKSRYE